VIRKLFLILKKDPIICAPLVVWALSYELLGFLVPDLLTNPFHMSGWFLGMVFLKLLFSAMTILLTAYAVADRVVSFNLLMAALKKSIGALMVVFVIIDLLPRLGMFLILGEQTVEELMTATQQYSWVYLAVSFIWGVMVLLFMVSHQYILLEHYSAFRALKASASFVRRYIRPIIWLLLQLVVFSILGLYLQVFLILGPEWFNGFVAVIRGVFLASIYGMITLFFIDYTQPKVSTLIE